MWKTTIFITIIQNPVINKNIDKYYFNKLSSKTKEIINIENPDNRPSLIFYELLNCTPKDLNKIFSDSNIFIQILSNIHTPVAIFIDKIDQAFTKDLYRILGDTDVSVGARNASLWQYSQLSLANAAYDIFSNINNHIKVFFTIRQEALLDAEEIAPNLYRNFSAYITSIEYSKKDLLDMFALYVSREDDDNLVCPNEKSNNPVKAFFGVNSLEHGYVKDENQKSENMFDYLYRHSVGRPYDIQKICFDLFLKDIKNLNCKDLKHYINESARHITNQYIAELQPITNLSKTEIGKLLAEITTNIFDFEYMREICKRYMIKCGNNESCKMNCQNCNDVYPFSKLYNLGLLGYFHTSQSIPILKHLT